MENQYRGGWGGHGRFRKKERGAWLGQFADLRGGRGGGWQERGGCVF